MPPARPRVVDDSRSESSSIITNLKDRASHIQNGVSKGKKIIATTQLGPSGLSKQALNGTAAGAPETDPNLPRTSWTTFPTPLLHAYAFANRLPTPPAYTHPHADLLYASSRTALRAPSAVAARRRLRDLKSLRRKDSTALRAKDIVKDRERSSERLKNATNAADAIPVPAVVAASTDYGQRQSPSTLAMVVRRHFNSAQVNEADAIARFLYVVRHGGAAPLDSEVRLIGGEGDGRGRAMGSEGREVNKGLGISAAGAGGGADLGFRLRFRP